MSSTGTGSTCWVIGFNLVNLRCSNQLIANDWYAQVAINGGVKSPTTEPAESAVGVPYLRNAVWGAKLRPSCHRLSNPNQPQLLDVFRRQREVTYRVDPVSTRNSNSFSAIGPSNRCSNFSAPHSLAPPNGCIIRLSPQTISHLTPLLRVSL